MGANAKVLAASIAVGVCVYFSLRSRHAERDALRKEIDKQTREQHMTSDTDPNKR